VSIPAYATREELSEYMAAVVGAGISGTLGWTAPDSYDEAVIDTLIAYGGDVKDVYEATDIPKLRAVARMEVWRAVMEQTAGFYDITAPDGIRAVRNQIHAQAVAAYKEARRDAQKHGVNALRVERQTIRYTDPFTMRDEMRLT
jgi:hypothetical protein